MYVCVCILCARISVCASLILRNVTHSSSACLLLPQCLILSVSNSVSVFLPLFQLDCLTLSLLSLSLSLYIYIYIYIQTRTHTQIYIYIYIYACNTRVYIENIHLRRLCTYMYVCMYDLQRERERERE